LGKRVRAVRFKGRTFEIKFKYEALPIVCEIIRNEHGRDFHKVLEIRGVKKPYFSKKPSELKYPKQIAHTGIYVETNFSMSVPGVLRKILTAFGYPLDSVEFLIAD